MDTMDTMEECLDDISSVLTTCEQLNVSDLQALDRAVYCLKSVCARLAALLNEEASSDGHNLEEDGADLNQLHLYLCQLCVDYETQLLHLVPSISSPSNIRRRGRPRNILNLPLVRSL